MFDLKQKSVILKWMKIVQVSSLAGGWGWEVYENTEVREQATQTTNSSCFNL